MTQTPLSSKPAAKDKPWIFRTYAGHSTAEDSNKLFRLNLAKGQTGLSVAFDLPTQTGYDSDHIMSVGEVGKVGVPISHIGDMRALFRDIPIESMNTSMTINATAPWLMALYIAVADERGIDRRLLQGTTQNDVIKEYLARGTYVFPPEPSLRLSSDLIVFTSHALPKWNPINVCSYHLQEAGATPEQELSYAMATAIAILDYVKNKPQLTKQEFDGIVGRISFFCNAGMRFITEVCKMRAFGELWDEITRQRYDVLDESLRRFRYGVQVNSLGLTEQQPENNVIRIMIEMLSVVLSKKARARAVQLPAWNEALGLPRPFDQQWSLRMQQIMAFETDLLEFEDIFDGSAIIHDKVNALKKGAYAELDKIASMGGAIAAIENGYMKEQLVLSNTARVEGIEDGHHIVVGVNQFAETEVSPLTRDEQAILKISGDVEAEHIKRLQDWRRQRDDQAVHAALENLRHAARSDDNIMEASIAAAHAGVTTGEWADVFRQIFGEYRAPTGISTQARQGVESLDPLRDEVERVSRKLGRRLTFVIAKPGLDGHSNGAEQIAVRARDAGMNVIYDGIRYRPEDIITMVRESQAHCLGLSILSGSHIVLVRDIAARLRAHNINIPLIVGGIIPPEDIDILYESGVSAVFTPRHYDVIEILEKIVSIVDKEIDTNH
jgi:ethylmalonyl-CoA mutase